LDEPRRPLLRLPIAAKLALAIELPLIVLFAMAIFWNFSTLKNRSLRDNEETIGARVGAEAQHLAGVFGELAALVDAAALSLGTRDDLTAQEARAITRGLVRLRPLAYGSTVAFAPGAGPGAEGLLAPYAHRSGDGVAELEIGSVYDYADGSWEWYSVPAETLRPVWTEPYFDKGAGDIVMCTYAAPFFFTDGSFRGVVTVDIPLARVNEVIAGASGDGGEGFIIVTSKGTIVSSPHSDSIMRNILGDPRIAPGTPAGDAVGSLLRGESRVTLISSFPEPGRHFLSSAPIPGPDWRLGAWIPERVVMAPVYAELGRMVLSRVAIIGVVLLAILGLSLWLARPVKRLHAAVQRIAAGDLDARAEGVRSRDELGDLARSFNAMAARLRSQVESLANEMAAREAVEGELRVARQIQASLLPRSFPRNDKFAIAGFNAPARYVAGDYYDNILEPSNGSVLFTIADVSGKGMPAAMMMAVTRTIVRNLAGRESAPDRIVAAANAALNEDESNGMFVTLVLARYEPERGALTYCNAGHPRPALVRTDGSVALVGDITGTVVGAIPEAEFSAAGIELRPGERLVFYTDGVTEARAPDGRFYGESGLIGFLKRHAGDSLEALCDGLRQELDQFQEGKRADDVTLLVLERRA